MPRESGKRFVYQLSVLVLGDGRPPARAGGSWGRKGRGSRTRVKKPENGTALASQGVRASPPPH